MKSIINRLRKIISQRWKLLLVVAVALAGLVYWRTQAVQSDQPEQTFQNPQYRNLTKTLDVSGVVDAKRRARLRFIAGGKITYLGAKEGEAVKKWQTIATIDQRDLHKRLEKSLNNYMKERWDWEQQLDDIENRWIDMEEQREVDKNQWDLENSVIDVELQDIAVSNTVMSSPFDGVLISAPVDSNNVQVLSTDYFEVVDPTSLVFKAEVDEEDIAKLKTNQPAELSLDAYPDEKIQTAVDFISYQSSQSSAGTVFLVEFPIPNSGLSELNNPLEKFRLGMNGDIEIILETRQQVLSIPFTAIKQRQGKNLVEVKDSAQGEGATQEKEVELGLETDDYVEIISGLTAADEVLIPSN